jgi:hypothetical protein
MSESSTRRDEPDELEDDDCSSYTLKLLSMTHEERQAEKQVRIDKKVPALFHLNGKNVLCSELFSQDPPPHLEGAQMITCYLTLQME